MNPKAKQILETVRELREAEKIEFETSWGYVKCHDESHVWFPRFFGEGIASKINRRTTNVLLTFNNANKIDQLCEALEKLSEAIHNKAYCNCQQSIAQGYNVKPCWGCVALKEVAEILEKGREG